MKRQKTSILQMFYGQRGTLDYVKMDEEYWAITNAIEEIFEKLRKKLENNKEAWQLFGDYVSAVQDRQIHESDIFYSEGFNFGLLVGIEAGESKFR